MGAAAGGSESWVLPRGAAKAGLSKNSKSMQDTDRQTDRQTLPDGQTDTPTQRKMKNLHVYIYIYIRDINNLNVYAINVYDVSV